MKMKCTAILLGIACWTAPWAVAQDDATSKTPVGTVTPRPESNEWVDLLAPERVDGWVGTTAGAKTFEIADGVLHILGKNTGTYAAYKGERLRDFSLHIEFRVAQFVNSGVILRGELEKPPLTGVELQVLDDCGRPPSKTSCGALYDIATPMFNMSLATGLWNSFDITFKGRLLTVFMNGWKILDVDLAKMTMPLGKFPVPFAQLSLDGYVCLEDHGGECWYRNIMLKRL